MKKLLPLLAVAALSLTGCVNINNEAPEESSASSAASSLASPSTASATPTPTPEATSASAEPTQAVSSSPAKVAPPTKTSFAGTTLKGNDISFYMLPTGDQQTLNTVMNGDGWYGTWASLCSVAATEDQLSETAVSAVSPTGKTYQWTSFKYLPNNYHDYMTTEQQTMLNNLVIEGPAQETTGMKCIPVLVQDTTAAQQGYSSITIGQYMGASSELANSVELF